MVAISYSEKEEVPLRETEYAIPFSQSLTFVLVSRKRVFKGN